jgi:hypothetical protein
MRHSSAFVGKEARMKDQAEIMVPAHLQELLQPTPSGTAKLIAAWDGLIPETQVLMLSAKKKNPGPAYLYQQIVEKAAASGNAFVRYSAAREIRLCDDNQRGKDLKAQIDNDPEPLVRYAPLETSWVSIHSEFWDPEAFFALPHEARLAKVRELTGGGELISELISHAVDNHLRDGRISELEIFEILSDYLDKAAFKAEYADDRSSYDGFVEHSKGADIEALWELVLKVPAYISHVLIANLPERAGMSSGIPTGVLDGMSARQLTTLFYRPDIGLEELRKRKFFEGADETDYAKDHMQSAAITHVVDFTNDEFAQILSKPDKQRVTILRNLSLMARGLRLCLYEAIHDVLFTSEVSPTGGDYVDAEFAKRTFEGKLKQLKGWEREKQLLELKLYRLAVQAVPWNKKKQGSLPSGKLVFLKEALVEGDTWATFVAFCREWDEAHFIRKSLGCGTEHLPRIWEAGEEDDLSLDEDGMQDADRLGGRVADRLADLLATIHNNPGEEPKLSQALGKLSVHATVVQEKTLDAVNSVKAELAQLSRSQHRQRVISWTVIGLLVAMLVIGI